MSNEKPVSVYEKKALRDIPSIKPPPVEPSAGIATPSKHTMPSEASAGHVGTPLPKE